jgi:hypothetical protein
MDFADFYCSSIDPEGDLALARRLFAPTDRYAERIARRAHMMRSDCDVVVGVHIRWGDFREWQDGRYFFPIEEYLRLMREALEHFSGKKVLFLVACNEALSADVFKPFDVVMAPGHIIDDLYLLAECDCTIGTTSGYHWWAANYRGIPSFSLTERGQRLVFL